MSEKSRRRRAAYNRWRNMMKRCYDPSHRSYPRYGGRGVRVVEEWHDFPTYYRDTGDRPTPQHTGDRVDPNGPYCRANFRWATPEEQSANRNDIMKYYGAGKLLTLKAWAKESGIPYKTMHKRIHELGWPPEKAVTTPKRGYSYRATDGDEEILAVG